MDKTIVQVPISKSLRDQATEAAANLGFSSLQESVRVFLAQLARQEITIGFDEPTIRLSPAAIDRYNQMVDDIDSGKADLSSATTADDLMEHLDRGT